VAIDAQLTELHHLKSVLTVEWVLIVDLASA
jgi:hypothetical protein